MAYTTIDDPSEYFQAMQYTGNTTAPRNITNDGNSDLKPDFIWSKANQNGTNHVLTNSTLGWDAPKGLGYAWENGPFGGHLSTSSTGAASQPSATYGYISGHLTDGFTTAAGGTNDDTMNTNGTVHNAWQWKCNGGTTTTFSESGNNPGGKRQTSTTAGFSIIYYKGTGANASCQIAHGLGKAPEMVIFKRIYTTQVWAVYHQAIGVNEKLVLNSTDGEDADGAFMNGTVPDATNIYVGGTSVNTNANDGHYMCYAWTSIQGFSKFGNYQGNSNDNGPFVYTGFKPRWIMFKSRESGSSWDIMDTRNSTVNPLKNYFTANTTDPRGSSSTKRVDFLSNGFKLRDDNNLNFSDHNFTYMAFAENPFVTSTGIPTTARA